MAQVITNLRGIMAVDNQVVNFHRMLSSISSWLDNLLSEDTSDSSQQWQEALRQAYVRLQDWDQRSFRKAIELLKAIQNLFLLQQQGHSNHFIEDFLAGLDIYHGFRIRLVENTHLQ